MKKKRSEASKKLNQIAATAARRVQKSISPKSYPCIIEGVWYNTMAEAGRALGLNVKGTIKRRLPSPSFPQYIWLKDRRNKILPEDPSLREKIQNFLSNAALENEEKKTNGYILKKKREGYHVVS